MKKSKIRKNKLLEGYSSGLGRIALEKKMPSEEEWTDFVDKYSGKARVNTPAAGIKPHITANAAFLLNLRTTQVAISIKNVEFDVDINSFACLRVRLGYFNGLSTMFRGDIVFQLLDAGLLGDLLAPRDVYLRFFGKTKWVRALKGTCGKLGIALDLSELSEAYNEVPIANAVKTERLKNYMDAVNYFAQTGETAFQTFGLKPPVVSFRQDAVFVSVVNGDQMVKATLPCWIR